MFQFGEKVIIKDPTLKSHNRKGLYVGESKTKSGQVKVYLEEPIKTAKTTIACVTIGADKVFHYVEDEKEAMQARLDFLYHRADELETELVDVREEIYQIEKKLMGR